MATIDSPTQQGVSTEVEATWGAMRTVQRPLDYIQRGTGGQTRVLGHYKAQLGPAINSFTTSGINVLSMRNIDASALIVLYRVSVMITVVTAVTAQSVTPGTLSKILGFTADFSVNATTQAPIGYGVRSTMPASQCSRFQTASAAAGMSGGTTGGTQQMGLFPLTGLGALGTGVGPYDTYKYDKQGEHPIILGPNEGAVLNWGTAVSTGTLNFNSVWEWAEVATF